MKKLDLLSAAAVAGTIVVACSIVAVRSYKGGESVFCH